MSSVSFTYLLGCRRQPTKPINYFRLLNGITGFLTYYSFHIYFVCGHLVISRLTLPWSFFGRPFGQFVIVESILKFYLHNSAWRLSSVPSTNNAFWQILHFYQRYKWFFKSAVMRGLSVAILRQTWAFSLRRLFSKHLTVSLQYLPAVCF